MKIRNRSVRVILAALLVSCVLGSACSGAVPDWKNNSLGLDDSVPAPWTPMSLADGSVSCWNRTYAFGTSAFPTQITAGDEKLLSGPVELLGTCSGRRLNWRNGVSHTIRATESMVTIATSADSAGVGLFAVTACEFDGFMRIDVTLRPLRANTKLDKLVLRIPMLSRYAKYRYGYGNSSGGGPGIHFPHEKDIVGAAGTPWRSDFLPGLWIGDTSHGIGWYCESQQNWSQTLPNNALRIDSEGTSVVLNVSIVDTPMQLTKPITLSFGLQATPVKPFPRPKDWLTFRPVTCPGNKVFFEGWGGLTRWGGFPVAGHASLPPTDPQAFDDTYLKASIAAKHAEGMFLPMYLNPATMALDIPEVQIHQQRWQCTPVQLPYNDVGQVMSMACPRSKDWQDLFLYRLKDFYDKYDVDAIYVDFGYSQRCDNPLHGCGYETASGRKGTFPIFALRELHKRIYKVIKAARPKSPIVTLGHPGGSQNLPHVNFWDACVEGEYANVDVRNSVYKGDYTAFYSPERFTTEFSGRPFSNIPLFMSYTVSNDTALTKGIVAMALANGSVVWPAWIDLNVLNPVYSAMDSFGVADIEVFLPYWDNKGAVRTEPRDGVYATVYKKPKKSLVAVSNLSAKSMDVRLRIDPRVLGLKTGLVVNDAISGESVLVGRSTASIPVAGKDFRLLVVSN